MKIREINEIIDANGELIGTNDVPMSGSNLDTAANNTTDYNQRVSQQPYRYDMMGRFGFNLMPFYEGKESIGDDDSPILKDLAEFMYDRYMELLKHYYQNPNKLKSDYRIKSEDTFETQSEDGLKIDMDYAKKIMKLIEPHFEKAYKSSENIDESAIIEDKLVQKKSEDNMAEKGKDNDLKDKKLIKIAGLLNKLEQKDLNKIVTLLEKKQ
jgi:hypothetical protein